MRKIAGFGQDPGAAVLVHPELSGCSLELGMKATYRRAGLASVFSYPLPALPSPGLVPSHCLRSDVSVVRCIGFGD